jgi:hypothetical protein
MDERQRRIGENEAIFREVNERVREVGRMFDYQAARTEMVCECGDYGCVDKIALTPAEYEQLRSDPELFAIRPGHLIPDVEDTVARTDRYWVIRKRAGAPADLARERDSRTR